MRCIVTLVCLIALVFAGGGLSRLVQVEAAPNATMSVTIGEDSQSQTDAAGEQCCHKQKLMETSCSGPLGLLASSMANLIEPATHRPKPVCSPLRVDFINSGMKRPPRFFV
ncbi:MAG: hypothetical protein AAF903_01075 [Pseudomonadota bacterium]